MTRIEHIDDVLPHVKDREDFVVAEREGFTAIDYVYAQPDSFDDPIRRECRGLKFGLDGRLIARPFAKFFNIGERPSTQPHLIDFAKPHLVLEKLDGSMIHPAIVDGQVVFMTRLGRSDQARAAEKFFLTDDLADKLRGILEDGITPIFEYTGPKNRIIIRYEANALTLLAERRNLDGTYLDREQNKVNADWLGLPLVPEYESEWTDAMSFLNFVRVIQGQEGFVLRFTEDDEPERFLLKAKGEDYVLKHKSKEAISLEKNALALILTDGLDDVIPLLTEEDKECVERYRDEVQVGMRVTINQVQHLVDSGAELDQKTFAVEHLKNQPSTIRSLCFSARRSGNAEDEVRKVLLKNTNSQTQVDAMRELFGAEWTM